MTKRNTTEMQRKIYTSCSSKWKNALLPMIPSSSRSSSPLFFLEPSRDALFLGFSSNRRLGFASTFGFLLTGSSILAALEFGDINGFAMRTVAFIFFGFLMLCQTPGMVALRWCDRDRWPLKEPLLDVRWRLPEPPEPIKKIIIIIILLLFF